MTIIVATFAVIVVAVTVAVVVAVAAVINFARSRFSDWFEYSMSTNASF